MKSAEKEYRELRESGFFWEFYPELSGDWEVDKVKWRKIHKELTTFRGK